ncbi:hypothetical protein L1049_005467 [Liquidambar formosana]|uniref:Uncharacterized protein n=1 Tax=Liquidambar formosana TaxID=63359 RepID=A0AAP0RQ70_LIQFO
MAEVGRRKPGRWIEKGRFEAIDGILVSKFLDNGIQEKGIGFLKVLDLKGVAKPKPMLPQALGQLFHLRLDRLEILKLRASAGGEYPYILPTMMRFPNNKHLYMLYMEGIFLEKLLDVHDFPPNLTILTLIRCKLREYLFPTLEKLQNLQILTLFGYSYIGKEMVCFFGGFQRLQFLKLWGLHKLETWKVEDEAMPSLRMLELAYCSHLKMIPDGLQYITTFQNIEVVPYNLS